MFKGERPKAQSIGSRVSPVQLTELSTQFSPTPRSLVTPSPTQSKPWSSALARPQTSFELSPAAKGEVPVRSVDTRFSQRSWGTPKRPTILASTSEISLATARKTVSSPFQLRKGLQSTSRDKTPFRPEKVTVHHSELEKDLQEVRKTLLEKESLISELQEIIVELETKMKADRCELADLKQENQQLAEKMKGIESELKAKVSSEIQRLTGLISENAKKFKDLRLHSPPTEKPPRTLPAQQESKEFVMFLLEENRRLEEELNMIKVSLKQSFETSLGSVAEELAAIRYDVVQLRTLLSCVKAGEQVRLDVFWGAHRSPEEKLRVGNYSSECQKEIATIRASIVEMKKVASDLYAEQCSQTCNTQ